MIGTRKRGFKKEKKKRAREISRAKTRPNDNGTT
jgi:hypothetical protein